jgi:hypothetical protein
MIKYMIAYHVCLEPPRRTPAAKGIVNLRFNSPFISWDGAIPANIEILRPDEGLHAAPASSSPRSSPAFLLSAAATQGFRNIYT